MNGIVALVISAIFTAYLVINSYFFSLEIYAILSVILFAMYWIDKRAAINGDQRISEFSLHIVSLLGGWPGGLVAQNILRHKTIKISFQAVFTATILINILGYIVIISPITHKTVLTLLR